MRPEIAPKHIRVKDEPEIATSRSMGGVSTVLYSGGHSTNYDVGDSGFVPRPVKLNAMLESYLVRIQYTVHGVWSQPGVVVLRMAMDLPSQGTGIADASSLYSSENVEYFGWSSGESNTLFFTGTAIVSADEDHYFTPWWGSSVGIGDSADGGEEPTNVAESWAFDIIDKTRNDTFTVQYSTGFGYDDLGESFTWLPFTA